MSTAVSLDGLLDQLSRCLDAESSRRVIELQVARSVQERIDALAERANEGALTQDERLEYEALINVADFISILQLKARQHLNSVTAGQRPGSPAAILKAMQEPPHRSSEDVDEPDAAIADGRLPLADARPDPL